MSPDELRAWLTEHIGEIFRFMDYEPTLDSEDELATTLGYWFAGDAWKAAGYRFVHLGIDGTGSQIAAWIRPQATQIPVVLFGSEGGAGVLAASCEDWAKCIAYAPYIEEYPNDEDDRLWIPEDEDDADAKAAQQAYKKAVEKRFGVLPPFEDLIADIDDLDEEFVTWVESLTE
jgi:hypothetical protein